jgi:putative acetyltransferase
MNAGVSIRKILPEDDLTIAGIIRTSLEEFGAAKPGTVYFDQATDHLSEVFTAAGSFYFVVLIDGKVVGGAGGYPTKNLPADTCELVKLYLSSKARGRGLGKLLIQTCESAAIDMGYKNMYLETMAELNMAIPLYEKMGYKYLNCPMGSSGHSGCEIWMQKKLIL